MKIKIRSLNGIHAAARFEHMHWLAAHMHAKPHLIVINFAQSSRKRILLKNSSIMWGL